MMPWLAAALRAWTKPRVRGIRIACHVIAFVAILGTLYLVTGSLDERGMTPMAVFCFWGALCLVLPLALWLERGCRFALSGMRYLLLFSAFPGVVYVPGYMLYCLIGLIGQRRPADVTIRDMGWIAAWVAVWLAVAFVGARRTRQGVLAYVASSKSGEREGRKERQEERLYRTLYQRGWGSAAIARRLRIPITAVATLAGLHETEAYGPVASVFDRPPHARPPTTSAMESEPSAPRETR